MTPSDLSRFGTGVGGIASGGATNAIASYLQTANQQQQQGTGGPGTYGKDAPDSMGLGLNIGTGKLVLGGLETLGSLWQAYEANKLAKESFNFQKGFANTNLANQIQSYNTTLEDRGRSRAFTEGQTPQQAQAYISQNRLPARNIGA